ncbi:MAG: zinc-binding dehydrogenase [Spirochaetes bacterium]|nr:zinc-binding dehydrogenase [Spirochaetota bacterium]
MYSIAVAEPGSLAMVAIPVPQLGKYDVLVKTEIAGICNATDRKLIQGHFPGIGIDKYPLLLGHESAGRVEAIGDRVVSYAPGDRALGGMLFYPADSRYTSAWGANSEYTVIVDHEAMVKDKVADTAHGWGDRYMVMKKIPSDISLRDACMLYTWREVYSGIAFDFRLRKGEDVLLFGAGAVGLSFIKIAKLYGIGKVVCIDPVGWKRERAIAFGADDTFDVTDDLTTIIELKYGKFDVIVDAVGSETVINSALPLLSMGGRLCIYGVIAQPTMNFNNGRAPLNFTVIFHQLPTKQAVSDSHGILIDWIRKGMLKYEDFVTGEYQIENFKEAFETTTAPSTLKTLLLFH